MACLYLHTLQHGKEFEGRRSVFIDSEMPRWSELASCGMVVQIKHECKLDTKKTVNKRRLSGGREMSGRIYNLKKTKTSHKIREVSIQS